MNLEWAGTGRQASRKMIVAIFSVALHAQRWYWSLTVVTGR